MASKRGRCRNYDGACHFAIDRKVVEVDDVDFVCPNPDCKQRLTAIDDGRRPVAFPKVVLLAAVLVLIAIGIWRFVPLEPSDDDGPAPPRSGQQTKPMEKWIAEFAIDR